MYPALKRHGGLMSMGLFQRIMDQAADLKVISQLCLNGLGEPTLDPYIVERVAYSKKKRPDIGAEIFSNGVHLTPAKFDQLRDAGLGAITVSVNAVTPEQHEATMGLKGKFDVVCANADYVIRNRGKVKVEIHAVLSPEWTRQQMAEFHGRWGHRANGGFGLLVYEANWAGANRTTYKFRPNESCHRALTQFHVMWDGRVTTCCFDPAGEQVFGDLKTQTIKEVYSNPVYVQFREDHFNDKADKYDICKNCTRI